jgi:hypothetical protein
MLLIPGNAMAKGLQDDKIITGGTYGLKAARLWMATDRL